MAATGKSTASTSTVIAEAIGVGPKQAASSMAADGGGAAPKQTSGIMAGAKGMAPRQAASGASAGAGEATPEQGAGASEPDLEAAQVSQAADMDHLQIPRKTKWRGR